MVTTVQREQLNWALRYDPLLAFAGDADGPVLDAGAGAAGLATYLPAHPIVAVDLEFDGHPLAALGGVRGSVLSLPFPNGAFSTVIASDLFEHLGPAARPPALRELLRVTRTVLVVGFPSGSPAMDDDRWLARRLGWLHRPLPGWLEEHLVLDHPVASDLASWCPPGFSVEVTKNSNRVFHRWTLLLELLPVVGRTMGRFAWQPKVHRLGRVLHRGRTYRELVVIRIPPRPLSRGTSVAAHSSE
jgi:SAM-dependent methyltransferase